jgi:hypothetical protein
VGRLAVIAVFGVVFLAGCGSTTLYKADKTRSCLTSEDATIQVPAGDFVATAATGGAFVARLSDNHVTIVFGQKETEASDIAAAYQHFAASNVRANIQDVLERYGNAVLLWHLHPNSADLALVTGCLK